MEVVGERRMGLAADSGGNGTLGRQVAGRKSGRRGYFFLGGLPS